MSALSGRTHQPLSRARNRRRERSIIASINFSLKESESFEFKKQVVQWLTVCEQRINDQLDHLHEQRSRASHSSHSSRSSRRSHASKSSRLLATKERAKVAELLAERSMLSKNLEIQQAEEQLNLDLKIAKAQARERVFTELEREEPDYSAERDGACGEFSSEMKHAIPPVLATSPSGVPREKVKPGTSHLHPTSPEFYYRAVPNEIKTESKEEANSSQRSDEELLKEIFKVQYEQLQSMISLQKQLATAVTLPQPEVPKFSGDPTKYKTFIITFDAHIRARVANDADRLYYLDQHLTGEPKDLIGGCLHLEPDVGYKEARRLLDKEYGDPYKVSNAFIQRLSNLPVMKYDDGPSLKRFSFFLTKCNNAIKAITHMTVLNHPPNMQSVVQKLPNNLQTKWRENVVKCRLKDGGIVGFEDLSKFVEFAAESANDPIYSKDALANTRAKPAPASGVADHYKKLQTPKPTSTSFATNVDASTQSPSLHGTGSSRRDAVVPRATKTKGVRCLLCHESHDIEECEGFKRKSVGERKAFLTERSLCFGCYGQKNLLNTMPKEKSLQEVQRTAPDIITRRRFCKKKGS